MSYQRNSNGYPHIFHHAQFTKVTSDILRPLLLPYIDMADTKPEVDCICGSPAISDNAENVAVGSGIVENVGVDVGISLIAHFVPEINLLPVY